MTAAVEGARPCPVDAPVPWPAVAGAIWTGLIACGVLAILPVFVGVLVAGMGLTVTQTGFLGSADLAGMAVGGLMFAGFLRGLGWRRASAAGAGLAIAANIASMGAGDWQVLLALRVLAGIGSGVMLAVAYEVIGGAANKDRAFGVFVAAQLAFSAAVLFPLPLLTERFGADAIFAGLAGFLLLSLPTHLLFPGRATVDERSVGSIPASLGRAGVCSVAAVFLYFAAQGAVWAFAERLASDAGLPAAAIGSGLAISSLAGLAAAVLVLAIGGRAGMLGPMLASLVIALAGLLLLSRIESAMQFTIGASAFSFSWNSTVPLQLAAIAWVAPSGRLLAYASTATCVGLAVGPAAAGLIVASEGLDMLLLAAAMACFLSFLMFLPLLGRSRPPATAGV